MSHPRAPWLFLSLLGLLALPAQADIYAFVDANGVAHFSNRPVDSRYRLFLKETAASGKTSLAAATGTARISQLLSQRRSQYGPIIDKVATETLVPAGLLHAVITAESGYNRDALSPKGAMGMMQLIPATAARYGVSNAWDPEQNIRGGAKYLRDLLAMFGNNLELAVAAYNAGEGAVQKYGNAIPPYKETQEYVPRVLALYQGGKFGGRFNSLRPLGKNSQARLTPQGRMLVQMGKSSPPPATVKVAQIDEPAAPLADQPKQP